jgi:uncharacterized protein YwgA
MEKPLSLFRKMLKLIHQDNALKYVLNTYFPQSQTIRKQIEEIYNAGK